MPFLAVQGTTMASRVAAMVVAVEVAVEARLLPLPSWRPWRSRPRRVQVRQCRRRCCCHSLTQVPGLVLVHMRLLVVWAQWVEVAGVVAGRPRATCPRTPRPCGPCPHMCWPARCRRGQGLGSPGPTTQPCLTSSTRGTGVGSTQGGSLPCGAPHRGPGAWTDCYRHLYTSRRGMCAGQTNGGLAMAALEVDHGPYWCVPNK